MAEEENKKKQNQPADDKSGATQPVQPVKQQGDAQNPAKKKRKSRRRKRKPRNPQLEDQVVNKEENTKKKKRRRSRRRNNNTQGAQNGSPAPKKDDLVEPIEPIEPIEDIGAENIIPVNDELLEDEGEEFEDLFGEDATDEVSEPILEPEPEKKYETEEELLGIDSKEEAFLAADEPAADEASAAEPSAEPAPSEPAPPEPVEATPPPPLPTPEASTDGPVGWDQLKQAIKSDYDKAETQTADVPTPAEAPKAEPEVAEKATSAPMLVPVPVPTPEVPEVQSAPAVAPIVAPAPAEELHTEPVPIVEPISSGAEELHADDDAEKKEIIRIIVKYTAGGCIVIVLIAAIFLFKLPQRIIGLFSGDGKQPTQQEVVIPDESPTETPTIKPDIDGVEEGIGTAILTGKAIPKIKRVSSGIRAGFVAGLPSGPTPGITLDRIESYINVLNKLQNAFGTDIHQLLDASGNRANTLEVHLSELKSAYRQSVDTFETLNEKNDEIKTEYNMVTTEKNRLEQSFFSAMERLESRSADKILNEFIEVSQKQINLKAEFNALTKTAELFEVAIRNMDLRIQDIEANKEALIKGVKVVNIKGSDLDLIIQDNE